MTPDSYGHRNIHPHCPVRHLARIGTPECPTCDAIRAAVVEAREADAQKMAGKMERLANAVLDHPSEPSPTENVVDAAVRLLGEMQAAKDVQKEQTP